MRSNYKRKNPEKTSLLLPTQDHELVPKICIMNLPVDINSSQLLDLFKPYGTIVYLFLKQQQTNSSNTYGFVQFKTIQQASSAIMGCDNQIRFGRRITVNFAKEKKTHNDSLNVSKISNQYCCACGNKLDSNEAKKSVVDKKTKRNEERENININDSPRFSSQDEIPKKKVTKAKEGKDKRKIIQVKTAQIKLASTDKKKVDKSVDKKSEKKVEKKTTEKEENRLKSKITQKSPAKPKQKEKEKKGDSLLALSTEISKSDPSEDYYTYEAKPFAEFRLKRQH